MAKSTVHCRKALVRNDVVPLHDNKELYFLVFVVRPVTY